MTTRSILDDFPYGALLTREGEGTLRYANPAARHILSMEANTSLCGWQARPVEGRSGNVLVSSPQGLRIRLTGSWLPHGEDTEDHSGTKLFVAHLMPLGQRLLSKLRGPDGGSVWQSACFNALVTAIEEGEKAVVLWDAATGAVSSQSGHFARWRAPVEKIDNMREWIDCVHPHNREAVAAAQKQLAETPEGQGVELTYHLLGRRKGVKAVYEHSVRLPSPEGTALVMTMWERRALPPPKPRPEDFTPQQRMEKKLRACGRKYGFRRVLLWEMQENGDLELFASWRAPPLKPIARFTLPRHCVERLAASLLPGGLKIVYTPPDLPGLEGLADWGVQRFMAASLGSGVYPRRLLVFCAGADWTETGEKQRDLARWVADFEENTSTENEMKGMEHEEYIQQ